MKKIRITLHDDGSIKAIYDESLRPLVAVIDGEISRISHIEPENFILRLGFRFLRSLCDDDSRLAAWTRTWLCRWRVDFRPIGYGYFTGFDNRQEAIDFELPLAARYIQEGKLCWYSQES